MQDDLLPSDTVVAPPVTSSTPHVAHVVFTGRGSEYFRIWVVNILLTLLTAGVYSAWAKVRTARYFRNNTRLDGHVFDYHGRPLAIFRGRVIALVLLGAYSWAFQFSNTAGLVTIAILCALGPWLFMRAQQFSLSPTPASVACDSASTRGPAKPTPSLSKSPALGMANSFRAARARA